MNGGPGRGRKKRKPKQKYMNIKMLRTEVASLIEELQRVTCETVEQIDEWRTEKDKEANNTEKGETTSGAEKDTRAFDLSSGTAPTT